MSWPVVKLKEVCNIIMGQAPSGDTYNEKGDGLPLIAGAGDFGFEYPMPKKHTTNAAKKSNVGDIILCIRATIGDLNWSDKIYCLGRGVAGLHVSSKLDSKYLWHFLIKSKMYLNSLGTGSTFKQIGRTAISDLLIPLPPLEEQKRIAAILDKADAIRQKRQKAIELADEFLRSVFLDMFGDPVTNPKGWEVLPIQQVASVITGNTPPRSEKDNYGNHIEWIKSDNINTPYHYLTRAEEFLSEKGSFKGRIVTSGAVLITCIAGSPHCIGNVAIADRSIAFNQQINALIPSDMITTQYVYSLVMYGKKMIQSLSTNSMKGMVSKGKLEDMLIPIPPIDLQNKYSIIFGSIEDKINKILFSKNTLEDLFFSIQKKVSTGK